MFPRLSPDPGHVPYEDYCCVRYLLHHPFRNPQELQMRPGSDKEVPWSVLLPECEVDHPVHARDTLRRWEYEQDAPDDHPDDDEGLENPDQIEVTEEDWMLYARFHPNARTPVMSDAGNRPFNLGWDVATRRLHGITFQRGLLHDSRPLNTESLLKAKMLASRVLFGHEGEREILRRRSVVDSETLSAEAVTKWTEFVRVA